MRFVCAIALAVASVLAPGIALAGQFGIYEENDTFGLDSHVATNRNDDTVTERCGYCI